MSNAVELREWEQVLRELDAECRIQEEESSVAVGGDAVIRRYRLDALEFAHRSLLSRVREMRPEGASQ